MRGLEARYEFDKFLKLSSARITKLSSCYITMTGTGLKKWRPVMLHVGTRQLYDIEDHTPTTREAVLRPSALVGDTPSGTAVAAIFVMEIDEVLLARIVCGETSLGRAENMDCFTANASDTAWFELK